jgi:hypothetical protein
MARQKNIDADAAAGGIRMKDKPITVGHPGRPFGIRRLREQIGIRSPR